MEYNLKYAKNLKTRDKLQVPCASFEEAWAQTSKFSNTPFNMR